MTDHNSPEEIEKRKNQEDPIVMYLVVRKSIASQMSVLKTAAQVGHAVSMLDGKFRDLELEILAGWSNSTDTKIFNLWLETSYRKIVLVADEGQWSKLKELPNHVLVIDAGLTEISPNTETVIGLWPMKRSDAHKTIVKKLQARL